MIFRRSFTVGPIVFCFVGAACSSTVTEYHDSPNINSSAGNSAAGSSHSEATTAVSRGGNDGATSLAGNGGASLLHGSAGSSQSVNTSVNASGGVSNSSLAPPSVGGGAPQSGGIGAGGNLTGGATGLGGSTAQPSLGGNSNGGSLIGGSTNNAASTAAGMSHAAGRSAATGGASGGTQTTGGAPITGGAPTGGRNSSAGASGAAVAGNPGTAGAAAINCDPLQPFGALKQIVPSTTTSSENSMTVASDGLSAILAVRANINDTTSSFDLKRYSRLTTNDVFGFATDILGASSINTTNDEYQPRLTPDRLTLYFTRATSTKSEILVASRAKATDDFPAAVALDVFVNSSNAVGQAFKSLTAEYFYWISDSHLYRATVASNVFSDLLDPVRLNSIGDVFAPVLTDDELTIYLASKGTGTTIFGSLQIWRATRDTSAGQWNLPTPAPDLADTSTESLPADVSPDGCIIYVTKKVSSSYHLYQASKPR